MAAGSIKTKARLNAGFFVFSGGKVLHHLTMYYYLQEAPAQVIRPFVNFAASYYY